MRAMAMAGEKGSGLVELKAVDGAYPTVGELVTEPPLPPGRPPRRSATAPSAAAVDAALLARLDLKVGDRVTVGRRDGRAAGARSSPSPTRSPTASASARASSSPQEALRATGPRSSPAAWCAGPTGCTCRPAPRTRPWSGSRRTPTAPCPEAGWEIRSRVNADPRFARNIERFTQFLTLVGLTALLVGGVGVANAVRGFVDRKRASIATLKSLGAPGGQVVALYLVQVMLIAALGIAIGLARRRRAAVRWSTRSLGHLLPIPIAPTLAWRELGVALLYGALTALAFALAPLGRAHDVPVSGLFRDQVDPERRWPRRRYLVALAVAVGGPRRPRGAGRLRPPDRADVRRRGGRRLRAPARRRDRHHGARPPPAAAAPGRRRASRSPTSTGPGALTPSLVLSLGLGITLLVTLALIDANLTRQLTQTLPEQAPSFFFLDIPNAEARALRRLPEAARRPSARIDRVPMMRGRLVSLSGVPVGEIKADEQVAWVLDGDRGITYAAQVPEGSTLVAGEWWPADYRGKPLVSFDQRIAEGLGLERRRRDHRQRARPQPHGDDRQPAHGGMALPRHQLRHGVLAQHLRGRAAHPSRHRDLPGRRRTAARSSGSCATPPEPIRP